MIDTLVKGYFLSYRYTLYNKMLLRNVHYVITHLKTVKIQYSYLEAVSGSDV